MSEAGSRGSGDLPTNTEPWLTPFACRHHLLQAIDGIPDVAESRVERRHAESEDVGRAEIADDALRDQGLDDRMAARRVRERHR